MYAYELPQGSGVVSTGRLRAIAGSASVTLGGPSTCVIAGRSAPDRVRGEAWRNIDSLSWRNIDSLRFNPDVKVAWQAGP
jgi:hypothetical protein